MVTIGHINAIHGLQNVPHSGEEDGPRGRMRDGREEWRRKMDMCDVHVNS